MTTALKRTTIVLSALIIVSIATIINLVFSETGFSFSRKTPPLVVSEAKYTPPVEKMASEVADGNQKDEAEPEWTNIEAEPEWTNIEAEPEWTDIEAESNWYYSQVSYTEGNNNTDVDINNATDYINDGYIDANIDKNWVAGSDLRFSGLYQDSSGYSYTYYSENVLPGGGLNIPGRHVGDEGYVMDGDGNLCVASSDLPYGTMVNVPFGTGTAVVYDTGCSSGILDIYVSW